MVTAKVVAQTYKEAPYEGAISLAPTNSTAITAPPSIIDMHIRYQKDAGYLLFLFGFIVSII
jgi:hypothetical protein